MVQPQNIRSFSYERDTNHDKMSRIGDQKEGDATIATYIATSCRDVVFNPHQGCHSSEDAAKLATMVKYFQRPAPSGCERCPLL